MALTFRNLLDRLAEMEGKAFASWTPAMTAVRVAHVNAALRWAWRTDDPLFAFPFSVGSDDVTVTSGLIDPDDLGDGTWCSLWTSDPRGSSSTADAVEAHVSHEGVHPDCAYTSVFAFFRIAAPQGEYAAEDEYEEPDDIPDALLDMVSLKALYTLFISMQQWDAVNALKASYGDPAKHRDALVESLRDSRLAWEGNEIALTPAAAVAAP